MADVRPYLRVAALYDEILGDRFFPRMRRMFEWIERRYGLSYGTAADAGCGTGTFVAYLRRRGVHPVWGVDSSPEMLAQAVAKNAGNGARFLLQDLRLLSLPARVDLVTCQFDTLNYLLTITDLRAGLAAFARTLEPGGAAVFDVVTPRAVDPGRGARLEVVRSANRTVTRRSRYDARLRLQVARVRITDTAGTRYETHVQRAYAIDEVIAALDGTGLCLCAVHAVSGVDRPAHQATRAVFLARRSQTAVRARPPEPQR